MHRRAWKLDLIARVEARIHAEPADAPGRGLWPEVTAASDEYRRVRLRGTFLRDRPTLVQAVTEFGAGYWVMAPLRTPDGSIVLVNRGFVPAGRRDTAAWQPAGGEAEVTGLLRMSEPGGAFLRANDPAADRWYSRDVAAIEAARGLRDVAPYFVDAAAPTTAAPALPVAGLTVVDFRNNHLVYALTWYALAGLLAAATLWVNRDVLRRRTAPRRPAPPPDAPNAPGLTRSS